MCAGNAFSLVTEIFGWLSSCVLFGVDRWDVAAEQHRLVHVSHSTGMKMNQLLPAWEQHRLARVLPWGSQHCHTSRVFALVFS